MLSVFCSIFQRSIDCFYVKQDTKKFELKEVDLEEDWIPSRLEEVDWRVKRRCYELLTWLQDIPPFSAKFLQHWILRLEHYRSPLPKQQVKESSHLFLGHMPRTKSGKDGLPSITLYMHYVDNISNNSSIETWLPKGDKCVIPKFKKNKKITLV